MIIASRTRNRRRARPAALAYAPAELWSVELSYSLTAGKISRIAGLMAGNHATQSGGSARPTLAVPIGHLPYGAVFAGAQRLMLGSSIISSAQNWTIYSVFKCTNTSAARSILYPAAAGLAAIAINTSGAGNRNAYLQAVGSVEDGAATTDVECVFLSRDVDTLYLEVNGVVKVLDAPLAVVTAPSGSGFIGSFSSGGTFSFIGTFYEGAVWTRLVPLSDRQKIAAETVARFRL